ncbi:MAG: hypothetical protein ACREPX_09690 [Rhodanobacteraceae bacterium]
MKSILAALAIGALLAVSSIAGASDTPDAVVGTWNLDVAKSKGNAPMPKSETRTYTDAPGGVTVTWTRVGADGKESTVSTTFKYDGKDYPVTGSPDFDMISAKRTDAHTIESIQKRGGKDIGMTQRRISADGKTLTLATKMTTADGKAIDTTMVYDRK